MGLFSRTPPVSALKRVLVLRDRFFGDTILTVPFLRNLRAALPDAKIDVLVAPRSGAMLTGCPFVDELIEYDTTRFHRYDGGTGKTGGFFGYAKLLRARRYDGVFLLKRSLTAALLAFATGAKFRAGHATEGRSLLLTHRTPYDKHRHEVESTLDVLRTVGIPIVDDRLEAWPDPADVARLTTDVPELAKPGPKILIHATAAVTYRQYPVERWAPVVRALVEEDGAVLFYTGAAEDAPLYRELDRVAGIQGVHLAGKLAPRPSLALYSRLDAAVGVDSGPMHMAAACGIPTVTLFGPTDPVRWKPWGPDHVALFDTDLACRPCDYKMTCRNRECLTEFPPERLLEAARTALRTKRERAGRPV